MKWIKASERLPEDRRNKDGSCKGIFVEFKSFDETNAVRTAYTANQIADFSKSPYYKELLWLDESPLPSNDEDELWEEAWDESTYIEDDIDSLQQVAGSCVITKRDFDKLKSKFHITRK